MMGRGMPSSHNNMPLPNPMISSLLFHVPEARSLKTLPLIAQSRDRWQPAL
jgi:hypothetical protein